MEIQEITKYTDFLLSLAISKCGNQQDADDLVQETILAALTYLSRGNRIDDYKPFLSSVLNRKYYDMLRKKYKTPTVTIADGFDITDTQDFVSDLIRDQESENVRKEIAFLSETYRNIIISHYFSGKSVKEIAKELKIPEGTVKSRLNFGRKQLKKGVNDMKAYTENSYSPQYLRLRNSGTVGMNEEPMSLTESDTLAQNLLILAYNKPLTINELSKAIGVASAYVEPVINKLVGGELMKRTGDGRVYTDFIIYQGEDWFKYIKEQEEFAEKYSDAFLSPFNKAVKELKETDFYSLPLERFMMLIIAQDGLFRSVVRKPQIFPDRPNGGKWIAFATVTPKNYKISAEQQGKVKYGMSGRRFLLIDKYLGADNLEIQNFETYLDPNIGPKSARHDFSLLNDVESNMLKLFYLIKHNISPETVDLDTRIIKAIPSLCELGYISFKNGIPEVLIPCLNHSQYKEFSEICNKAVKEFGDNIRIPLTEYCNTHKVKIPPHLKSVPEQKLTMPYEPSPMIFVFDAINKGAHPRDLGYPCPETIAIFD